MVVLVLVLVVAIAVMVAASVRRRWRRRGVDDVWSSAITFAAVPAAAVVHILGVIVALSAIAVPAAIPPTISQRAQRAASDEQTGYGQCSDPDQSPTSSSCHSYASSSKLIKIP